MLTPCPPLGNMPSQAPGFASAFLEGDAQLPEAETPQPPPDAPWLPAKGPQRTSLQLPRAPASRGGTIASSSSSSTPSSPPTTSFPNPSSTSSSSPVWPEASSVEDRAASSSGSQRPLWSPPEAATAGTRAEPPRVSPGGAWGQGGRRGGGAGYLGMDSVPLPPAAPRPPMASGSEQLIGGSSSTSSSQSDRILVTNGRCPCKGTRAADCES